MDSATIVNASTVGKPETWEAASEISSQAVASNLEATERSDKFDIGGIPDDEAVRTVQEDLFTASSAAETKKQSEPGLIPADGSAEGGPGRTPGLHFTTIPTADILGDLLRQSHLILTSVEIDPIPSYDNDGSFGRACDCHSRTLLKRVLIASRMDEFFESSINARRLSRALAVAQPRAATPDPADKE